MDQESTKPSPIGGTKGSWRDRLGINKELPKISEEFKQTPPKAASSDHPELRMIGHRRRRGLERQYRSRRQWHRASPRAISATAFASSAKQPSAWQRNALPKQRNAPFSSRGRGCLPTGGGAPPPGQRPKFTFADEEFRQAQQEPREPRSPPPRQWTPAPPPANSTRPVFTADKAHDRPQSAGDPRPRALMPPRNPPPAGAGSYRAPSHPAIPPRGRPGNYPPPSYPPQPGARGRTGNIRRVPSARLSRAAMIPIGAKCRHIAPA